VIPPSPSPGGKLGSNLFDLEYQSRKSLQSCGSGFIESGTDPAFQVNPDPDPVWIQGVEVQKRKKKNTAGKIF
jgi:hypothetical protein